MGLYDIAVEDEKGRPISLSKYAGNVLLIVNTATNCVFTPQYKGLQDLYSHFHDKGFFVLDFPCNQFRNQAPGTNEEIHSFCVTHYATTFPRFSKIKVNGPDASLLYVFLKRRRLGFLSRRIKWNFTKFLIDRKGNIRKRYGPMVPPEKIAKDIDRLL